MEVLLALTSHDQLGDTGRKTSFLLEELAAPYYVFKDAGAQTMLASPKGGQPPLDPKSNEADFQTAATRRFEADPQVTGVPWGLTPCPFESPLVRRNSTSYQGAET